MNVKDSQAALAALPALQQLAQRLRKNASLDSDIELAFFPAVTEFPLISPD